MTNLAVGVDGGGTKTVAHVANEQGTHLAEALGPASAMRVGHAEHSAQVIAQVVREALQANGTPDEVPNVLCVGVAGIGRESARKELLQALLAHELADELILRPDYEVALDDAFMDGPGIVLIAGTGSVAFGRSPDGASARCGGWGPVFGDEGSAAWLGRRALSVITAAADGREPDTSLTGAILTTAQLNDIFELVTWAADATPSAFAVLAPVVIKAAENSDLRANSLLSLAVEELALHIRALARQLFADERAAVPVALTGGMLKRGSLVRKRLEHRLKSVVPGAQVHAEEVIPARGAVRAAMRALNWSA